MLPNGSAPRLTAPKRQSFSSHEPPARWPDCSSRAAVLEISSKTRDPGEVDVSGQRKRDVVLGDDGFAFFSTVSTFGAAYDITTADLTIEAFYPATPATARHLLGTLST